MALADLVVQANTLIDTITQYVVTPLLIFFIGVAAGKLARNLLRTVLSSVEMDTHAQRVTGQPIPATELIAGTVAGLIYAAASIWALHSATILIEALQIIGIILGIFGGVALIMGARDFLPNLYYGFSRRKDLQVGDRLSVRGVSGEIVEIGWLSVQISTENDESVAVPYRGL